MSQTESQTGDQEEDNELDDNEEEFPVERVQTKNRTFERKKSTKKNPLEESLIRFLNRPEATETDAAKSFLDSLLPTLKNFTEDQKLQFRVQVLNLMMKIKSPPPNPAPSPHYYPVNNFRPLNNFPPTEQRSSRSSTT